MTRKEKFSLLWMFALFNYIYADIHSFIDPATLKQIMTGYIGSLQITKGFLLGSAILIETAIAMAFLSRLLPYGANRWANIIVGVIHTAAVAASIFVGETPALYYMFFGTIEMACTAFIVWSAWKWPKPLLTGAAESP
jgi:hypothetical protein